MEEEKQQENNNEDWPIPSGAEKQTEKLNKMLYENLTLTKEIHRMTKKINSFVIMSRIFSIIKVLLIVIPILLGVFYLPPLINEVRPKVDNMIDSYKELLGISKDVKDVKNSIQDSGKNNFGNIDVNQMSPELRELLGK